MTEYDYSPEAYQAHLANMSRISKWVDRTEEHRPEFANAAALTEQQRAAMQSHAASPPPSPGPERRNSFGGRRRNIPPPLPLHPYGTPDPAYAAMGIRMSPYGPMHSADEHGMGFVYANGPGSPGPMPRSAGAQMMVMAPPLMSPPLMSPPPSPPHHHHHHGHSRRSRANSFSLAPPPPFAAAPYMGMGMGMASPPPGYAPAGPSYVIMPPSPSRHHHHRSGRHRGHPGVSYVVSNPALLFGA
ncbi:hypothetical protein DXG01_004689 [Tephrocybe rancida]|nr:hypothetical protein DXG01_004689 [Tephrocybe rancida]